MLIPKVTEKEIGVNSIINAAVEIGTNETE